MNPTKIDLTPDHREQLCMLLNARLADIIDLTLQAKQAHWNVKGPHFISLHKLFDEVYEQFAGLTDDVAERLVALGGNAEGLLQIVSKRTTLPAYPLKIHDGKAHVDALSSALAVFGKTIRQDINRADELGDADTADLFTQISRTSDKYLWFVEAHLYSEGPAK
ncbi:DNA starvation/stationary phase protection protein Dps [Planctomicrobium piriforme]|uniref:Starvation-inducible DNA-binding protein n=1 Tax=Planctomicrobium piriforme TaxID=1576369 RepID=A0A1I3RU70_9PLAN|nr:starvation-inducible DNA-binding protein [Planctomicrobium piriforme]